MKTFTGFILVLCGLAAGLYAGLWWAFIGGIVQIAEAIKADPVQALDIGLGITRVIFAGFIGTISVAVLALPGAAMLRD